MDSFNKAFADLFGLLRSMTPAARITTGLLLVAVVVSLGYLFRVQGEKADGWLFGARILTQREIANMEAAFGKAGLNGFQIEQQRVRVPRALRHSYLAALAEANALPEYPGFAAEAMFRTNSPLESRDVRERKARRAQEMDLASTLREMSGIDEASVEIEEVDRGGFPPRKVPRAVASVRTVGNTLLNEQLETSIRRIVAFGGGVELENVNVIDLNSGLSFAGSGKDGKPYDNELAYGEAQRRYEEMYRKKIEDHLSMIPGVKVDVFVDLNKSLSKKTSTQKYDAQPVAIRTSEYAKDVTSKSPENAGRVGAAANNVGNTPQVVSNVAASESTSNETRTDADSITGATQEVTEQAGLVPEYVKAAISVPRSYFEKVWREENPAAPGEDPPTPEKSDLETIKNRIIASVENRVAALLPEPAPGEDKFPRISVEPYTPTPLPSPPSATVADKATAWFAAHWQTLGMFLLAVFGVLTLRNMLRAAQSDTVAPAEPQRPIEPATLSISEATAEEDDEDDLSNSLKARFQHSGRSLRDELTELVREDPDAAANVLQIWLGDAA